MRSWKIPVGIFFDDDVYAQVSVTQRFMLGELRKLAGRKVRIEMDVHCKYLNSRFTTKTDNYLLSGADTAQSVLRRMSNDIAYDVAAIIDGIKYCEFDRPVSWPELTSLERARIVGHRLVVSGRRYGA